MNSPQPPSATANAPLSVRCRPDLIAVETLHKHESAVVIKDPVALKYHRLRRDEYFVLQLLDGNRSLQNICDLYHDEFRPQKVTASEINQLVFRFHQLGLTVADVALQGDRLRERQQKDRLQRWKQHLSGVLFIRFPGIDPEPILRRLYPLARPLLRPLGIATLLLICLSALLVMAGRWEQFVGEVPRMNQWLRLEALLILAAVIGTTKVFHEFGHAIVCKHFGGECHQIGPMLLVFTPALYCDTSDSWMLPNRFQRAAVGMAGIATEVLLAAIATLVWASTAQGLTHYLAMNVMLVCSVSTVLFNANPLLRYDGYYVLADLCDVPNLAEKSRSALNSFIGRHLFGVRDQHDQQQDANQRTWLLVYAVAAAVYRWAITFLILWFVAIALRPYRLESIGRVLCLFAFGGLLYGLFRTPARFLTNPAKRRKVKAKRTSLSTVALGVIVVLVSIPFRSSVNVDGRLVPRVDSPIYITTPGQLSHLHCQPGDQVNEGDAVATLVNEDLQLQLVIAQGRYDAQRAVVESMRQHQFESPQASAEIPAAKALLDDLKHQLETKQSRVEALTLRSPASGTLLAAPKLPKAESNQYRLVSWHGYPTDAANRDCYLESGTELMSVAEVDRWNAELVLSQSQVQRISVGSSVKLICAATPTRNLVGQVTEISKSEWTAQQNAHRRDDPSAANQLGPAETSYLVRVELDDAKDGAPPVPGSTVSARIAAQPISVVGRAVRTLNSLFRFR